MAVDAERARDLALALPAASEAPHFHRLAFRTPRKMFATLDAQAQDLNLMFNPELRDFYCEQAPDAFRPVPGGWGRQGATRCDLQQVNEATLQSALQGSARLGGTETAQSKTPGQVSVMSPALAARHLLRAARAATLATQQAGQPFASLVTPRRRARRFHPAAALRPVGPYAPPSGRAALCPARGGANHRRQSADHTARDADRRSRAGARPGLARLLAGQAPLCRRLRGVHGLFSLADHCLVRLPGGRLCPGPYAFAGGPGAAGSRPRSRSRGRTRYHHPLQFRSWRGFRNAGATRWPDRPLEGVRYRSGRVRHGSSRCGSARARAGCGGAAHRVRPAGQRWKRSAGGPAATDGMPRALNKIASNAGSLARGKFLES